MTDAEMDELNSLIAIKIMRWRAELLHTPAGYLNSSNQFVMGIGDWHPTRNREQAMDVLTKLTEPQPGWNAILILTTQRELHDAWYGCNVHRYERGKLADYWGRHYTLPLAIFLAVEPIAEATE